MNYNQISFSIEKQHAEEVSNYLFDQDALSVTIESANGEQQFDLASPTEPQWEVQTLAALFSEETSITTILGSLRSRASVKELRLDIVEDQDWERSWLDQFSSVQISENLWVCPSWISPPDATATNLIIDPGLAFGTGTHPTTYLCLEYLARADCRGKMVIDYGCGSGILAIASLALGAAHAVCVDVDEKALDACCRNARINGVENRLETKFPEQCVGDGIDTAGDIVIANILANTLVDLRDRLLQLTRPGGILMLSGILHAQETLVRQAYGKDVGLQRFRKDDWALFAGRKIR